MVQHHLLCRLSQNCFYTHSKQVFLKFPAKIFLPVSLILSSLTFNVATAADIGVAWCGGANGNWSDPLTWGVNTFTCGNFNPVYPNNGVDNYFVGIDSYDDPLTPPGFDRNGNPLNTQQPSTVNLDVNVTISYITIGNNDALSINNGKSLVIENAGTLIENYGRIILDSLNASGLNTVLTLKDGQSLTKGGEVIMSDDANNIIQTNNTVFTNGAGHTIRGSGKLLNNSGGMLNRGTILGGGVNVALRIDPNALDFINEGVVSATGAAGIEFAAGNIINTSFTMTAQNLSKINFLSGSVLNGGTLATAGSGVINLFSGTTLDAVTSEGLIRQGNGQLVTILNDLVNNNRWEMNSTSPSGLNTVLTFSGIVDQVILGSGELVMTDDANNVIQTSNIVLTNGIGHTIRGSGKLLNNTGGMVNNGSIIADGNLVALVIDPNAKGFTNMGTLTADGTAGIDFAAGEFNNFSQSIDINNASRLDLLSGSKLSGGTLQGSGSAVVNVFSGTTLSGITSEALIKQDNGQLVTILNDLVNNNRWQMNSTSPSGLNTVLTFSGIVDQVISGSGELVMTDDTNNLIQTSNTVLTNAAGHTIRGSGRLLNNTGGMVNMGRIIAEGNSNALVIDPNAKAFSNQGDLIASGTAGIDFAAGIFNNAGQLIDIQAGSRLDLLSGSILNGGTLQTTLTSVVNVFTGTTLNDVTSEALIRQGNGQGVTVLTGLVNNNRWQMDSLNGSGLNTVLTFSGNQVITGVGELVMSDDINNIIQTNNSVLANGAGHTIRGAGRLLNNSGGMINNGRIIAEGNANAMIIDPNGLEFTNRGNLIASGTAGIDFSNGVFNNDLQIIDILDGSRLDMLAGSLLNDGTLQTTGSGIVNLFSGTTLNNVTSEALIKQGNGQNVTVTGGLTNNNRWEMNSTSPSGLNTVLTFSGAQVITGSGELVLTDDINNLIQTNNTVLTNGPGHIIRGAGRLLNNTGGLLNRGEIRAEGILNALVIDPNGLQFTNQGTVTAMGSAGIDFAAGVFNNTNKSIDILNASRLDLLAGSLLNSGTLLTVGTGVVNVFNGSALNSVKSEALIKQGNGQSVTVTGGLNNNSQWQMNSSLASGLNTVLTFSGNQTLSGNGELLMSDDTNNLIQTNNAVLFIDTEQTLRGSGRLLNNTGGMVNQGAVIADGVLTNMIIDANALGFDNQGLLHAAGIQGINISAGGFTNSGNVTVDAVSNISRTGIYQQTAGTTNVNGTLSATGIVDIQGGILSGSGIVFADTINDGIVAPGNSAGQLDIDGDYTQLFDGLLDIELGGNLAFEYDVLDISATATLDGILDITLINGFIPVIGDTFDILIADVINGQFDLGFVPLLPNVGWEVTYLTDEFFSRDVVRLTAVNSVPLPAAVWLFISGIIGLVCVSRVRQVH